MFTRVNPNNLLIRSDKSFESLKLSNADARAKYNEYCERRKNLIEILMLAYKPSRLDDESKERWEALEKKRERIKMNEWMKLQKYHGHAIM